MAINTLAFAEKLSQELDKALVQKSVTGFMADNVFRSKFVGAKTVLIPTLEMSGLGDYDRDKGFVTGALTLTHDSYTLTQDRARTFHLDSEDEDETGIANLAGQVMGEFVRTQVAPEMDAYILSKLATLAETKQQTITGTPASQAYKMFAEGVGKVQNVTGYDEELVAFVDSAMWSALQTSAEVSRQIVISDFKKGEISTKVKKLNDVAIIPVADARMKTAFTFNDGTTEDQEAGGFAPAASAKNVGLIILPKRATSLVKKTEKIRIFEPNKNQSMDAYKLDYRLYYDAFIKKSMEGTVFAYSYTVGA